MGRVRSPSPEESLLLALAKLDPDERARAAAAAIVRDGAFSWERALDLASGHRVHALLARNLEPLGEKIPAATRDALGRMRISAEARNERYVHAVAPALDGLNDAGVPAVLLKGAALALTIYPPGTRPLNDLDMLIRRRDYEATAAVLSKCGFECVVQEGRTEQSTLRDYHELGFVKRIGTETLSIDLHWRIYPRHRAYTLPVPAFLERARPVERGPLHARATAPEDTFVHLATQIGNDNLRVHFGRVADLHALVRSGLDWERLVATACPAGAAGITHLALELAALLGAEVPRRVLWRLANACPGCRLATAILADPSFAFGRHELRVGVQVALVPLLLGRPWKRIAYLLSLPLPHHERTRRLHILNLARSFPDYLARLRGIGVGAACAALMLAERAAAAAGLRRIATRLRDVMWKASTSSTPTLDAGR